MGGRWFRWCSEMEMSDSLRFPMLIFKGRNLRKLVNSPQRSHQKKNCEKKMVCKNLFLLKKKSCRCFVPKGGCGFFLHLEYSFTSTTNGLQSLGASKKLFTNKKTPYYGWISITAGLKKTLQRTKQQYHRDKSGTWVWQVSVCSFPPPFDGWTSASMWSAIPQLKTEVGRVPKKCPRTVTQNTPEVAKRNSSQKSHRILLDFGGGNPGTSSKGIEMLLKCYPAFLAQNLL